MGRTSMLEKKIDRVLNREQNERKKNAKGALNDMLQ